MFSANKKGKGHLQATMNVLSNKCFLNVQLLNMIIHWENDIFLLFSTFMFSQMICMFPKNTTAYGYFDLEILIKNNNFSSYICIYFVFVNHTSIGKTKKCCFCFRFDNTPVLNTIWSYRTTKWLIALKWGTGGKLWPKKTFSKLFTFDPNTR